MKKVALITGGSRGIGLGIATTLAKAGFDLAINGVRPREAVQDTITLLQSLGARILYCQADIANKESRAKMLDEIETEFGRLNILINNAGIAPRERKDILEASEESFAELIQTNLQGPYFLTQAVANRMIKQSRENDFSGCIVNISSISAVVASVNRGEYCISK